MFSSWQKSIKRRQCLALSSSVVPGYDTSSPRGLLSAYCRSPFPHHILHLWRSTLSALCWFWDVLSWAYADFAALEFFFSKLVPNGRFWHKEWYSIPFRPLHSYTRRIHAHTYIQNQPRIQLPNTQHTHTHRSEWEQIRSMTPVI